MTAIFTTEPMMNRALAAEIRHDPIGITALLEKTLGLAAGDLGTLTSVRCEGIGAIDVVLTYADAESSTTVGLETKFDHELSREQVEKELRALADDDGHLVFVLPEITDAPQFPDAHVVSWNQVLTTFTGSRLTSADIDAMPLTKRRVERYLETIKFSALLDDPAEWEAYVDRGGRGNPSIVFRSLSTFGEDRQIRGQIQVTGQGTPAHRDDVRFEYHIGIQINEDDDDFPADGGAQPPAWVPHLQTLRARVVTDESRRPLAVSPSPAPIRSEKKKPNPYWDSKIVVADRHLNGQRWLVKGYTDGWALGIKSTKHTWDELPALCALAARVLNEWLAAERSST